jgi:hypothetical protein
MQRLPIKVIIYTSHLNQAFAVPPEFPETLRTLVREILRNQPQNAHEIHKFGELLQEIMYWIIFVLARDHFTQQLHSRAFSEAVQEHN